MTEIPQNGDEPTLNYKMNLWNQLIAHFNRKALMFTIGAIIALHETFEGGAERPFLLALAGALMGLPFVISADKRFSQGEEGENRGEK